MIFLDTDTFTLLRYGNAKVAKHLSTATEEVVLTIITRIEVLQGRFSSVLKASNALELMIAQERLKQAEEELGRMHVVAIKDAAAARFERFVRDRSMRKIGRADLAIACIALEDGGHLVSRNTKDFRLIPGLKLENWAD